MPVIAATAGLGCAGSMSLCAGVVSRLRLLYLQGRPSPRSMPAYALYTHSACVRSACRPVGSLSLADRLRLATRWLCDKRLVSLSLYAQDRIDELQSRFLREGTYTRDALVAAEEFSAMRERRWAMDPAIVMLVVAQLVVATAIGYATAVEVTIDGFTSFFFCMAFGALVIVAAKKSGCAICITHVPSGCPAAPKGAAPPWRLLGRAVWWVPADCCSRWRTVWLVCALPSQVDAELRPLRHGARLLAPLSLARRAPPADWLRALGADGCATSSGVPYFLCPPRLIGRDLAGLASLTKPASISQLLLFPLVWLLSKFPEVCPAWIIAALRREENWAVW
jgi:hypothetical protein